MEIKKENTVLLDVTKVSNENTSLQHRPGEYKIFITIEGVELLSVMKYRLDDAVEVRDKLTKKEQCH